MTATGSYTNCPGYILDVDDYIRVRGDWYKLVEREGTATRYSQQWLLVNKSGGRLHYLISTGDIVTAYRWDR